MVTKRNNIQVSDQPEGHPLSKCGPKRFWYYCRMLEQMVDLENLCMVKFHLLVEQVCTASQWQCPGLPKAFSGVRVGVGSQSARLGMAFPSAVC